MEFLKGGSLDSVLRKKQRKGEYLSDEDKVRLACGIASGMVHLHAEKILHRDVRETVSQHAPISHALNGALLVLFRSWRHEIF